MDDDLQHPPEEIPKLIAAMESGEVDVVIGRYIAKRHSRVRNLASWMMKRLSWYTLGVPQAPQIEQLSAAEAKCRRRGRRLCWPEAAGRTHHLSGHASHRQCRRRASCAPGHERTSYRPHRLIAGRHRQHRQLFRASSSLACLWRIFDVGHRHPPVFYLVRYLEGDIRVMGFTTLVILLLFFMGTDDVRLRHRRRISHSHRLGRRATAARLSSGRRFARRARTMTPSKSRDPHSVERS